MMTMVSQRNKITLCSSSSSKLWLLSPLLLHLVVLLTLTPVSAQTDSKNIFDQANMANQYVIPNSNEYPATGCWTATEVSAVARDPLRWSTGFRIEEARQISQIEVYTSATTSYIQRMAVTYARSQGLPGFTKGSGIEDSDSPLTSYTFPDGVYIAELRAYKTQQQSTSTQEEEDSPPRVAGIEIVRTDGITHQIGQIYDSSTEQVTYRKEGHYIAGLGLHSNRGYGSGMDVEVAYYVQPRDCGPCSMTYLPASGWVRRHYDDHFENSIGVPTAVVVDPSSIQVWRFVVSTVEGQDYLGRLQLTYSIDNVVHSGDDEQLHELTSIGVSSIGLTTQADITLYTDVLDCVDLYVYPDNGIVAGIGFCFSDKTQVHNDGETSQVCREPRNRLGPYGIHESTRGVSKISTCRGESDIEGRRFETIARLTDITTVDCPAYLVTSGTVADSIAQGQSSSTGTLGELSTAVTASPTLSPTNSIDNPYTVEQLGGLSIDVSGNATDGSFMSFNNSACAIRYRHRPWGVGCKLDTQFRYGSGVDDTINFVLELVFLMFNPNENEDGMIVALDVGLVTPKIGYLGPFEVPTERVFRVTEEGLEREKCDTNLLYLVCGSICIQTLVQFNKKGDGALAIFTATIKLWDDSISANRCRSVIEALGLEEPITMDLDLGNMTYGAVKKKRDVVKRRPSRRRGADLKDDIVTEKGEFAFGATSIPPPPIVLPPPEQKYFLEDNYTLGVKDSSFQLSLVNTGCGIVAKKQPWSVDCNATIQMEHGQSAFNGGRPFELQIFATGVVNTTAGSEYLLSIRYGVRMPQMSITYSEDKAPINFGPIVYPGGTGYFFALTEYDIDVGVCISNLEGYFGTVSEASLKADQVGDAASVVGLDVCFQLKGSGGVKHRSDGAQLKFIMATTLLRKEVALPGTDPVLELAWQALNITGPITFKLDMGQLLVDSLSGLTKGARRQLVADGYMTRDGAFNLGNRIGMEEVVPDSSWTFSLWVSLLLLASSVLLQSL